MTKNMLIDAVHPEETRVVVTENNQIQEFDFESSTKAPLRGNIYLAKVTRVEPSLQAAFVEYGGNRHGFLAFNEIHPDYYQIPVSDREALLAEQAEEDREQAASDDDAGTDEQEDGEEEANGDAIADVGGDAHEEAAAPMNKRNLHRKYKIQEVIKRRQVILVQVMKEERGNKGAALTTYMSLAGRYCVLMPNTARGGGISRKINNGSDRKKLKKIVEKLDVPQGMGLIVRTAGSQRTLTEIRRDWQYLSRLWEEVREKTVSSSAPALVYEEGDLIRRCIRDLYSKEFDEVVVAGAEAYKEAKSYMKLLMPSHARKVKQQADGQPLFKQHGVEDKLAAMFNPVVALPSGGYLVINPTEALVSIDVNSGKSTKEFSVEKTALATNLEAAVEVARQARLRDLAGLLVIDFIDMDENRNNRAVERKMKEELKNDRACIQVGRISSFGLMEMSRQRMRAGVLEGSSETCTHCNGSGTVRSVESRALHVLRQIDENAGKFSDGELTVQVPQDVAIYLLNQKRAQVAEIESRTGVSVIVEIDNELTSMEMAIILPNQTASTGVSRMEGDPTAGLEDGENGKRKRRRRGGRNRHKSDGENDTSEVEAAAEEAETETVDADDTEDQTDDQGNDQTEVEAAGDDEDKPKRRRRRGRRGGRNRRRKDEADADAGSEDASENGEGVDAAAPVEDAASSDDAVGSDDEPQKIIIEVKANEPAEPDEPEAADEAEAEAEAPEEVVMAAAETEAGNDGADDGADDGDDDQPKKRGWWQR